MHYEKAEEVRIEIIEGMGEDVNREHSMFILMCIFMGCFIKSTFNLFKVFFKGLWCFIRYGYHRFMSWCDNQKDREVYER